MNSGVKTLSAMLVVFAMAGLPTRSTASDMTAEADVLALADAALRAISDEDFTALTDLMVPETVLYAAGEREGQRFLRTRTYAEERAQESPGDILERGFDPTVMVSGSVAMVWYPYDLWLDDEWVHCGVDIFNLVRTEVGWRIAAIVYSADQPPTCAMHPVGPPGTDSN
jgi:hypothetical protein